MGDTSWPFEVRAKLEALALLDPDAQRFGAATHRYALAPPLDEREIVRFEHVNGIRLPPGYRQFLSKAGNGGAGPVYGLTPLEAWHREALPRVTAVVETTGGERFEAGTGSRAPLGRPSEPARPFPLDAPWSPVDADDPSGDPAAVPGGEPPDPPVGEGGNPYDGCLHLAEIGCGYFYFLVVTGPRAGEVWEDYTAGGGAIGPTGRGFRAWYEAWLDGELRSAVVAEMRSELLAGRPERRADLLAHAALIERAAADATAPAERAIADLAWLRLYEGRAQEAEVALAPLAGRASDTEVGQLARLIHAERIDRATRKDGGAGIEALATDRAPEVRAAVAANPRATAAALERLAGDEVTEVRLAALGNPALPEDAALRATADARRRLDGPSPDTDALLALERLARNPGMAAPILERLATATGAPLASAVRRAVALSPRAPPDLLDRLSRDERPCVRHAVARNAATPREALERLAADPDAHVRAGLAGRPGAPEDLLARLAGDPAEMVRVAVAENAAAPVRVLVRLAGDLDILAVAPAVTRNAAAPAAALERLAFLPDAACRRRVGRHRGTPAAVRERLARDADPSVRAVVAGASGLRGPVLAALLEDPDERVRKGALGNPGLDEGALGEADRAARRMSLAEHEDTPPERLAELAADSDPDVRWAVARNSSTTPATLERLAQDPVEGVRDAVAWQERAAFPPPDATAERILRTRRFEHPSFPVGLLRALLDEAASRSGDVGPSCAVAALLAGADLDLARYAGARHPWVPVDLLERLACESYIYTRAGVAARPDTPPDLLLRLAADPVGMVRCAAAANDRTPLDGVERIALGDRDADARSGAARNPRLDRVVLDRLAGDVDRWVRRNVLRNPATPAEIVEKVAHDPDPEVRRWAAFHARASPALLERLRTDADSAVRDAAAWRLHAPPESMAP